MKREGGSYRIGAGGKPELVERTKRGPFDTAPPRKDGAAPTQDERVKQSKKKEA